MLRGSADEEWESVEILPRYYRRLYLERKEDLRKNDPLMESVGDDLALLLRAKAKQKVGIKYLEGKLGKSII